jgi:MFS family permease
MGEQIEEPLRKNRPFQAVMWAYTFTYVFGAVESFAVPIIYLNMSHSVSATATIATVEALASAITLLVAGSVVDRFHKVWVMRIGQFFTALLSLVLFFVVMSDVSTLWIWLVAAALQSCATAFSSNAEGASMKSVVPTSQMYRAMNIRQIRSILATLIGPALGGAIVQFLNPDLVFLFSTAGIVFALIVLFAFLHVDDIEDVDVSTQSQERGIRFAFGGVKQVFVNPVIRSIILVFITIDFAGGMLMPAMVYGFTAQGIPPMIISTITIVAGVCGLVGVLVLSPILEKKQLKIGMTAFVAILADAVLIAGAAVINQWIAYAVSIGIMTALVPIVINGMNAFLSVYTPDRLQGRIFAANSLVISGVGAIVPSFVGLLLSVGSISVTMITAGGFYVLSAVVLLSSKILRRLPASKKWGVYIDGLQRVA